MERLSPAELERYKHHIKLPEIGEQGQTRLKSSRVIIVGAGGLGSPVLLYLAAAGVGTLGIVDDDCVEESNLQRQVLFNSSDVGLPKCPVAESRLSSLNPSVSIVNHSVRLKADNALSILRGYDLVIDGSDNFETRYIVNDACCELGLPFIGASILGFEGQVSCYNAPLPNGERGPTYRCLFPAPPDPASVPACGETGVLGTLPGIVGTIMANEALKRLMGVGEGLAGRLFVFDALSMQSRLITFARLSSQCDMKVQASEHYTQLCAVCRNEDMKEITPKELKAWTDAGKKFQLIDVREPDEREIATIGGELIPLGTLEENLTKVSTDQPVVVYCRSGGRSGRAVQLLSQELGLEELYNLDGGILRYADEVDDSLTRY